MKTIPRNVPASETDNYPPELLAEDEPRYLRRQKPVDVRRKKLSGRSWIFYRRVLIAIVVSGAGASAAYVAGRFLLYSPRLLLSKPDQIEVLGNHMVGREAIVDKFYADRGRSLLRVPLDVRRAALETIPWVEQASVQRILPNRLRVEITERAPVAFLRFGTDLSLIDAHGVILDRPAEQEFQFAIITGISDSIPREERERRVRTYQEFLKEIDLVKPGASDLVSEVNLSNPKNLAAIMTGLAGPAGSQAVTIYFGQGDFVAKYRMLMDNFALWQANAGRIQSIDLQYTRQVVVNPETNVGAEPQPGRDRPWTAGGKLNKQKPH